MDLTARQQRFVDEYLIDLNATQAAIRAGYSAKTAEPQASRLLTNVKVSQAVAVAMNARAERLHVDADWVLRRWVEIAQADPNELIQYRRGCCPECWGDGDPSKDREPNPECTKCGGEGHGRVHLSDTRTLTGSAKRLYAGVQLGRDGIKVNMRDQDAAVANIARHLGMFPTKVEVTGKDGGPIELRRANEMTDDELATIVATGRRGVIDPPQG